MWKTWWFVCLFLQQGGCWTLFVACHQESWGIPGDHSVCQQHVQELCHISHFLLEDGAVHYKHNRSGEISERGWSENMLSGHVNQVTGNFTSDPLRVKHISLLFSPGCRFELLQVLRAKTVMAWQVYQSPGAALRTEERRTLQSLLIMHWQWWWQPQPQLTLSSLVLYGALLSVMDVCVRLYFPDNSCQNMKCTVRLITQQSSITIPEHAAVNNVAMKAAQTHPAEKKRFPRVTQPDQQHSASDGFAGEKVLQKHWQEKKRNDSINLVVY